MKSPTASKTTHLSSLFPTLKSFNFILPQSAFHKIYTPHSPNDSLFEDPQKTSLNYSHSFLHNHTLNNTTIFALPLLPQKQYQREYQCKLRENQREETREKKREQGKQYLLGYDEDLPWGHNRDEKYQYDDEYEEGNSTDDSSSTAKTKKMVFVNDRMVIKRILEKYYSMEKEGEVKKQVRKIKCFDFRVGREKVMRYLGD